MDKDEDGPRTAQKALEAWRKRTGAREGSRGKKGRPRQQTTERGREGKGAGHASAREAAEAAVALPEARNPRDFKEKRF
jgi:hypothetical protein